MPATRESQAPADQPGVHESVPPARGRVGWVVFAILVLGGGAAMWFRKSAGGPPPSAGISSASAEARAVPVVTAIAIRHDVPIYLEGLGNAVPLATVTVRSQVDGRLDKVEFREGQSVKKGEVLAQIDPRPFVILLHQGEAALARDTAQSRDAKLNLERYKSLVAQKLIPQQQVDDQENTADQALAAMAADQAQIENARLQLDYASIKSPVDGVTGVRLVDPGNIVHASDTGGIVVVTQLDPMAVIFTLPQDDLPRVAKGLAKGPLTVEAYTRDGSTRVGVGKLELVDNQVNQATATIRLKAIFANPGKVLWPNAFLKVRLLVTTERDSLVIPATAVQRGPQGTFVYLVDAAKTATVRPIDIDSTQDESAIISKGLEAGDQVVVEGQNQLRPGAKVAPRPASSQGASRVHTTTSETPGASP